MSKSKRFPDHSVEHYATAISAALLDLFRPEGARESEQFYFDLVDVDATAFFTAIPVAAAFVYRELSGSAPEDTLGMTHILNRLVVQWTVKKGKA